MDYLFLYDIFTVMCILAIVHETIGMGKHITQREIYYRIIERPEFSGLTQDTVNSAIRDVCCLLRVPRCTLGVLAAPKGQVFFFHFFGIGKVSLSMFFC